MMFLKGPSNTGKQKHIFLVADRSTHIVSPEEEHRGCEGYSTPTSLWPIDLDGWLRPSKIAITIRLDFGLASSF